MNQNKIKTLYFFTLAVLASLSGYTQCNGSSQLCATRYNKVSFLTTHNSYNSGENEFKFPNQNHNITTQLNDGVRALMLDVYEVDGQVIMYHGVEKLGSSPFLLSLLEIKAFLDANPNEIVTIMLESYVSANQVEDAVVEAGLSKYLHYQNAAEQWPTLKSMINADERLVIFTDKDDANGFQGWYHYVWDFAFETSYSAKSFADFTCEANRGDRNNALFILNHFITSGTGTGNPNKAQLANSNPYFISRVRDCEAVFGRNPNFVTVDFYDQGDAFAVVDELNGLDHSTDNGINIYPNPAHQYVNIQNQEVGLNDVKTYSMLGEDVSKKVVTFKLGGELMLDVSKLEVGVYLLKTKGVVTKLYKN